MKLEKKYRGVVVPMVTPFRQDSTIDEEAVGRIVDSLLAVGAVPFVLGTTGESASISASQKEVLVKSTVASVNGRSLVYAGISSTCVSESIEFAKSYADLGADVLVATLPAYYPLTQDLMRRYFEELADRAPLPLMIYNMPATTNMSIPIEVIDQLSHHSNIVGVKDSERGMERLDRSIELWKDRPDFVHFLGWAAQSAHALQNGSDGIVPSTGNFAPEFYVRLYKAVQDGDFELSNKIQTQTDELGLLYQKDRLLSQSLPALKVVMNVKGLCEPNVLPPMYRLNEKEEAEYIEQVKKKLTQMNIDY